MISVALPTLTLTNDLDADPTVPFLVGLPGWYDTADVKMRNVQRHDGHGDFDEQPVFDDALYFSVVGKVVSPDNPASVFATRSALMGLKAIDGQWPTMVTDPLGVRTAQVRVAGSIRFELHDENSWAEFEVPLKAKDPRRYGPVETVTTGLPASADGIDFPISFPIDFGAGGDPGRAITTNIGEVETYSTIEVTGGVAGGFSAVCVELGREIRFERQIPVDSRVLVDLRTGQAFLDDQSPVSGFLTRREWWTNPPGETRTIQFNAIGAVTGTPQMTVRTAPAYP